MPKIVNDPVHGFINIKFDLALKCIDHPYFQRLRNISQLGLTHSVYPGAVHSRFHHALGAFHLMQVALGELKNKGVEISYEEEKAACIAILLHDIGHGPYSHALEKSFFKSISHEQISFELMKRMNFEFKGALDLAISIFSNKYERKFFYQLISSQLDVDRLDYLKRDSFYSGVVEGNIGVDRILAMIDVRDNQIVVHEKGIMSVQHFLLSRHLMYWQVYLHKTVLSAEFMLIKLFERVYSLIESGISVQSSNNRLDYFFKLGEKQRMKITDEIINNFIELDDSDIWAALKSFKSHSDPILSDLASRILSRKFYKVSFSREIYDSAIRRFQSVNRSEAPYYHFRDKIIMNAYSNYNPIMILEKSGKIVSYENFIANQAMIIPIQNQTEKEFYYYLEK